MKNKILKRDNFTCQKCGFKGRIESLEVHHIDLKVLGGENNQENLVTLCSICHRYAPNEADQFKKYLQEKIDGNILNTFRNSNHSISQRTRKGMMDRISRGRHITRAPKGYSLVDKKLVPSEEKEEISQIFEEFLNNEISLTQLAKNHNMTTAGIKKLLSNSTYLGKVKFANQETEGTHESLISEELFDRVQEKLKNVCWGS